MLQAPSNGQPASQVQTDTTVVLRAPNSGLRLERERERETEQLLHTSKLFFIPKTSISLNLKTAQNIIVAGGDLGLENFEFVISPRWASDD